MVDDDDDDDGGGDRNDDDDDDDGGDDDDDDGGGDVGFQPASPLRNLLLLRCYFGCGILKSRRANWFHSLLICS